MTFVWTSRFERAYRRLSPEEQAAADATLRQMERAWRHPSLRTKKLAGTHNVWAIRISRDLRLTFEPARGVILLRNVGHHDPPLRSP